MGGRLVEVRERGRGRGRGAKRRAEELDRSERNEGFLVIVLGNL